MERKGGVEMTDELKNISLTGRLCYLFMCIEKYLFSCYPDRDWTPAAKKCWQWTNGFWDVGCDEYDKIVPAYLFEFDNYQETNDREFDGMLSKEDYDTLTELYAGITNGRGEGDIDHILMLPIEFSNVCEGTNFGYADKPTLAIIQEAQSILEKYRIELPSIDKIKSLTVDQKNGWGEFMESEWLSEILTG